MQRQMILHNEISDSDLFYRLRQRGVCFGGNRKLKIYGTLSCASGRKMKRDHRVFFSSESEAIENGFRPCGHCMKAKYQDWKRGPI